MKSGVSLWAFLIFLGFGFPPVMVSTICLMTALPELISVLLTFFQMLGSGPDIVCNGARIAVVWNRFPN